MLKDYAPKSFRKQVSIRSPADAARPGRAAVREASQLATLLGHVKNRRGTNNASPRDPYRAHIRARMSRDLASLAHTITDELAHYPADPLTYVSLLQRSPRRNEPTAPQDGQRRDGKPERPGHPTRRNKVERPGWRSIAERTSEGKALADETNPSKDTPHMTTLATFQVGETYFCRSICDYDCIYRFKIEKRTEKSVWISYHGKTIRRAVRVVCGVESIDPHGRYSMSPVLTADKVAD